MIYFQPTRWLFLEQVDSANYSAELASRKRKSKMVAIDASIALCSDKQKFILQPWLALLKSLFKDTFWSFPTCFLILYFWGNSFISSLINLVLSNIFEAIQSLSKSFKVILGWLSHDGMWNSKVVLDHCYFHCGNKSNARISFKWITKGNISTTWKPLHLKKALRPIVYFTSRC